MNAIILIGRILFAFVLVSSGLSHLAKVDAMAGYAKFKKVPAAKLSVLVSGALLVVGGLSIMPAFTLILAHS